MAHLTNLTKKNIDDIIINYNILNYENYTPIYDGIQNSNYIINTKYKKYILTIFEDKYVINNLNFFLNLLLFCNKNNFKCPLPILDNKSNFINLIDNKPSCLFSFIEGTSFKNINEKNIKSVGIYLGKLHLLTSNFNEKINTRFDINFYNNIINNYQLYFLEQDGDLLSIFNDVIIDYKNLSRKNLPKAIIHGDLFPDNVLFNNSYKVTGFLDFYFSDYNYLISDLAIVIISWCFYKNKDKKYLLDFNKINVLLKSYSSVRKILPNEITSINTLCKIYCMRFMFTRLAARDNNYDKQKILMKNPHEYIKKLLYFKNNINFRNNINYE